MGKEIVKRLAPSKETLNLLFSLCGNECAFPGCNHRVYNEKNKLIAQVCHIESAAEGGERFNSDSNNEARRHFDNLIVLCYLHHVETDDVDEYTTERMWEMKAEHEQRCRNVFTPSIIQIDNAFEAELKKGYERIEHNTKVIIGNQEVQSTRLESMDGNLASILAILNDKGSTGTDYNKRTDEIFTLRIQQQQRAAISLFDNLKASDWPQMSDNEKYRLLVLKGICHLDLNEQKTAQDLFLAGYSHQKENVKAIYYGVLGHMLEGDKVAAAKLVEKGLKIDPENSGIVSAQIRMLRGRPLDEILAVIPEGMKNDTEVAFEVSVCMLNIKQYDEAISWNHIALKNSSGPYFDLKASLASAILESIFDRFRVFTNQVTQEMKNKAEYIMQLYNEAWNELSDTELRVSRSWCLLNRGIAKKLLGDAEGYYHDSFEAYKINPDFATTRHLFMVCNELGYTKKVIELIAELKDLADEQQIHEIFLFEAQQFLYADEFDQGTKILKELLSKDLTPHLRKIVLLEIISCYLLMKEYEAAEFFNLQLGELIPEEISHLTLKARIDAALGREDFATALLSIFQGVKDEADKGHIEVLANDLAKAGLLKEAIILNERITEAHVYSSQSVKLINLYLDAGDYGKVLSMASYWLEKYGPIRDVTIVVAHQYERINDTASAVATYQSYLGIYPSDQQVRYQLAVIYHKANQRELLKTELESFTHLDHHLSMEAQYNLALMLHESGFIDQAYNFSYETRRQFFDSAASHDRFIALSTSFDQSNNRPLDPEAVTNQCAVIVETDGTIHKYIIQERSDPIKSRGEILPKSFEAGVLMGKKAGDPVKLHLNNPQQSSEILVIQHLYNYAFAESMEMSFSVFAGETKMRKLQIGTSGDFKEDFKDIFKGLDKLEEYNILLEQNYATGNFPIGSLAAIRKVNPIKVWLNCISTPSLGVYSSSNAEEHFKANLVLSEGSPLLLDLVSLCTVFFAEMHPLLLKLPNKLLIAAASINEINELISELERDQQKGSMSLTKSGGMYIRQINTPEDIERQLGRFLDMKNWAETNCEVLPCKMALKMNAHEKTKFDKAIGESFVDSMLTAKEHHAILLSEESSVRGLAFQEYGLTGVASFSLLLYMNSKRLIDIEQYRAATIKLIAMYYRKIPVTSQTLYEIARKSNYHLNTVLESAFEGLLSDIIPGDKGADLGANFILMLYTSPIDFIIDVNFEDHRRMTCLKCLDVLCKKFLPSSLGPYLIKYYQNPAYLMHPQIKQIQKLLADYFQ